jgi:hypothetical protein
MAARAAVFLSRIDEVAKRSVDALHAVHEPRFLEVLEGAEYGHAVEFKEKIYQLAMGERPPCCLQGREDALSGRRGTQTRLSEHDGRLRTSGHVNL